MNETERNGLQTCCNAGSVHDKDASGDGSTKKDRRKGKKGEKEYERGGRGGCGEREKMQIRRSKRGPALREMVD